MIQVAGLFGVACLGLSAVFSGSLGSGDRIRANYTHEDEEDRTRRRRWATNLFFVGLPNVIGAMVILFLAWS
ncbi:DUF5316 family protein [Desulforudis sp. 1088]|uniref:DUF5316 family protein n=1 Tax=unclassified Candidatus Desulforudis TaxID=2635950 RepID=UPI003CE53CC9